MSSTAAEDNPEMEELPPTDDGEADGATMPLLDHLVELRKRLLFCFVALALAFAVSFYFARPIFAILVQPLLDAGQGRIIYTAIFEAFFVEIKVAFFAAIMVAFPVLATQIWRFVAPGLYAKERKAFLPLLLMTPILFAIGACMAYFVAMPVALNFLLGFSGDVGGVSQEALPGVDNYLGFATTFIFGFGLSFLLPLLLILLEKAGIVSIEQLKAGRRYAIVGAFVIAAILTPPDVVSQLLLAIPLVLLYELALLFMRITRRTKKKGGS